jgi:hypothetical protein
VRGTLAENAFLARLRIFCETFHLLVPSSFFSMEEIELWQHDMYYYVVLEYVIVGLLRTAKIFGSNLLRSSTTSSTLEKSRDYVARQRAAGLLYSSYTQ